MQEVAGERGGYLHGRGALDSDDLLYLKEQMEAEEDAERLLRRTEKRAFAAFKKAASLADSSPASLPLPLRVEPKPKSGIRQQDLLKNIVEIKPKRLRVSSPSDHQSGPSLPSQVSSANNAEKRPANDVSTSKPSREELNPPAALNSEQMAGKYLFSPRTETESNPENAVKTLLGLAYESSDED